MCKSNTLSPSRSSSYYENKGTANLVNPKVEMNDQKTTSIGNALITKEKSSSGSFVLGIEDSVEEEDNTAASTGLPKVILLPHQHTLFCERKQRVCTAVGKCQELEALKLTGNLSTLDWVWIRTSNNKLAKESPDANSFQVVSGTENKLDFTLGAEDVGKYIGVVYDSQNTNKRLSVSSSKTLKLANVIGPILPGPPRLLEFHVAGDLVVGGYAKAEGQYIGGSEGPSEYWWMRVTPDGKRSQVTDPKPIPTNSGSNDFANDPRYYKLTEDDIGCTLKSKCRPTRSDKAQGEIFTSKSSEKVKAK